MKSLFYIFFLLIGISSVHAQTTDTTKTTRPQSTRVIQQPVMKADRVTASSDVRFVIFGNYTITGYSILSLKSPSTQQLDAMIGSDAQVNEKSISGTLIDSISFSIFEVERLQKDDYVFRVFGREVKVTEQDLPSSFSVHKTDNTNCYGIAEIGNGKLAIPYKGVLLYLTRK